ncbi:MAG: hypothetical protein QOI48_4362 [Solirubrobacteraceae bacterium]|jgi:hypothetical protein|nr:hypothetical protein [Solirubrobacteraceae bacterium]
MPSTPAQPSHVAAGSAVATQAALLPCIQFKPDHPRLQVFFVEQEAVDAVDADPHNPLYDANGYVVMPHVRFGLRKLQPTGRADPAAVQRHVLAELRRARRQQGLHAEDVAEIDAVAGWLAASPKLEHTLHGLGLASVRYNERPDGAATFCIRCNPTQRFVRGTPPCCPR